MNNKKLVKKILKTTKSELNDLLYIKAIIHDLYNYFEMEYPSNFMLSMAKEHVKIIDDDIIKILNLLKSK